MKTEPFRLSVEELAFVFSQAGQAETGRSLLLAQLDPNMSQAEAQARLVAAGHSLLARQWVSLLPNDRLALADELKEITQFLIKPDFSLRFTRSTPKAETNLTYHVKKGALLEHVIEAGLIHCLRWMENKEEVVRAGMALFDLAEAEPFEISASEITYSILDGLKDEKNLETLAQKLSKAGVNQTAAKMLAEDIVQTSFRGTVMRIEYNEKNLPVSDRGFLLFKGKQRLWLMRPFKENPARVKLIPGTEAIFKKEVTQLIQE